MVDFNINHIDCSLRDGGYYTRWEFDEGFVNKYLQVLSYMKIKICEIGFRFKDNNDFKGPYAFSTEDQLNSLSIPKDLQIAVMLNASDFLKNGYFNKNILEKIIPLEASKSKVDIIRVACHYEELKNIKPIFYALKKLGYKTCCNIMQITEISLKDLTEIGRIFSNNEVDVMYFADSLGALTNENLKIIVSALRKTWDGDLGIHAHDNQNLALTNSLKAIQNGVKWIDTTITGIGRGPGNAKTEEFLVELNKNLNLVPLAKLINEDFIPLKNKYKWGSNLYYYLAGKYSIHPTYIQAMISDSRYQEEDILTAIDHFRLTRKTKFKTNDLMEARKLYFKDPKGKWSPLKLLKGKDVLIVGTGNKAKIHKKGIETFIKKKSLKVIALNTNELVDNDLIDLRVASHPMRLLSDINKHKEFSHPLVTPLSMLPASYFTKLKSKQIFDYGLGLSENGEFECHDQYCVIPSPLVLAYALAMVVSGKVRRIYLAGFDGYLVDDQRNYEVNDLITNFKNSFSEIELISITPSIYKGLSVKSVYGL
ncbi:aldolase [Prochlorococcus sp. AH-716-J21]|nr:aldolase [Prochlorococcus sp. AH-716-J21]